MNEMETVMSIVNERLEGECVMSLEETDRGTEINVTLEENDVFDLADRATIDADYFDGKSKSVYGISDIICKEIYPMLKMARRAELLSSVRYGGFPLSGFQETLDLAEVLIPPKNRKIRKVVGDIVFFYWVPSRTVITGGADDTKAEVARRLFDHSSSLDYETLDRYGITVEELEKNAKQNTPKFVMNRKIDRSGEHRIGVVSSKKGQGLSVLCDEKILSRIMKAMGEEKVYLVPASDNEVVVIPEGDDVLRKGWRNLIESDFKGALRSLYECGKDGLNLVEGETE